MSKIETNLHHRPDGREGGSLRALSCEVSCLNRPDGSTHFTSGSTQILAAVYGPTALAPRLISREHPTHGIVAVVFKQNASSNSSGSGAGGAGAILMSEREKERFIGEALSSCICLEMYPKCVIEIVLQVMTSDGSVVGTALNAAVVACLDAGIHMKSMPIATTCLLNWNIDQVEDDLTYTIHLDPIADEEVMDNVSVIVLVTETKNSKKDEDDGIISSVTLGSMTPESFLSCISAANKASQAVLAFIRLAIEQKCVRESKTLWLD